MNSQVLCYSSSIEPTTTVDKYQECLEADHATWLVKESVTPGVWNWSLTLAGATESGRRGEAHFEGVMWVACEGIFVSHPQPPFWFHRAVWAMVNATPPEEAAA